MHVHETLPGLRRLEQRVAGGRHLAQPLADDEQHVGLTDARGERGADADAGVACVVGMAVVEQILIAEGAGDRQLVGLGESPQRGAGLSIPAAAADQHQRSRCRCEQRARRRDVRGRGRGADRIDPQRVRAHRARRQHVFRKREHDRSRPARHRHAKCARDIFGNALGPIDLRGPLRHAAVHPAIVDLLERLAIDEVAADLADEHDQRRRVLRRRVDADRGVRRAGSTGDEGDAGATGQLAVRFGHVGGPAFLPADDEPQRVADVVERVQHGQVALARDAERERGALRDQVGNEDLTAGSFEGQDELRNTAVANGDRTGTGHSIIRSSPCRRWNEISPDSQRRAPPMPISDLVEEASLFVVAALVLALATIWLRRDLRKGTVRMAFVMLGGLAGLILVDRFGPAPGEGPFGGVLREGTLAILAIGAARITVTFFVPCGARQGGGAADPGRSADGAGAGGLRVLADDRRRRQPGRHRHHVRGGHRRAGVLAAGDARQPVGRHPAAARQHVPHRRLDPRRHGDGAGGRHPVALRRRRHQQRRDGHHPQREPEQEPRHGAGAPRRQADSVAARSRIRRGLRRSAGPGDRRGRGRAQARGDPERRRVAAARRAVPRASATAPTTTSSGIGSPISSRTTGPIRR